MGAGRKGSERRGVPTTNWEPTSSSAFTSWFTCSVAVLFFRDTVSNQDMESQLDFQKSTGAFISDKDRELEVLRNEVPLR